MFHTKQTVICLEIQKSKMQNECIKIYIKKGTKGRKIRVRKIRQHKIPFWNRGLRNKL